MVLVVLIPIFLKIVFDALKTEQLDTHAARGIFMTAGSMTWFWVLSLVPLAKVTALNLSAKVAAILLKKKRMNTSPTIQSLMMVASAIGCVTPFSSAPVKTLKAPAPLVRG
jgi:hypothetical protein